MKSKPILKFTIIIFLVAQGIFSETILLRNGTIITGKLKSQSIKEIVVFIDGKEEKISKDLVFRVLYRDLSEEEAKKTMLAEIDKLNPTEKEKLLSEIKDKSMMKEIEKKTIGKEKVELITKWGLVWRSALVPGWGHIKAEHYKTGFFYGVIFYGSLLSTAYFTNQLNQAIKERDEKINTNTFLTLGAGGPASAILLFAGGATSTADDDQKILAYRGLLYGSAGAALGVYIIQLINVYVLGVRIEKSRVSGINFYSVPEFSSLTKEVGMQNGISYTVSF